MQNDILVDKQSQLKLKKSNFIVIFLLRWNSTSVICFKQLKNQEGSKMKNKILALSIVLLLIATISLTSISFVHAAGEGQWITAYTIEDAATGEPLVEFNIATGINQTYSPVLPGADIKVTFTVNIIAEGAGTMSLSTSLTKSSIHTAGYWELQTSTYDMGTTYNPAAQSTSFKWTVGTFDMVLYGKVPTSTSSTSSAARPINIVNLGTVDKIVVLSTSADLAAFNTLYKQHEASLKKLIDDGISQWGIDIYTNVLNASKAIANQGDVTDAMALLNGLNASNPPVSSTMDMLYLPIIGVLAVLAVLFVVMFLRVRGKVGYFQLVVEDQIKDLEGLTLRASKIDRSMSSSLESVKDRLKRLVGM